MKNKSKIPDGYVRVNFHEKIEKRELLRKIAKIRRIPYAVLLREANDKIIADNTHLLLIDKDN